MNRETRKRLIGGGIAMGAAAAAVYRLSVRHLVHMAMDREEPRSLTAHREKLMGSGELLKVRKTLESEAKKLERSGCEEVSLLSHDGVKLVGHWRTCDNPKRVIVAVHGWRSTWARDMGAISQFWHDSGCCVLYAEQRGQGGSGGDYMGFGLLERHDCLRWIHWVNRRTGGSLPVYLGGVSMGATTILMTAGFRLPENVRGIVADCAFTSPCAIWKHVAEHNLKIPYVFYRAAADQLCKKRIRVGAGDYSTTDAMQGCSVPVLLIHGTDDRLVPIEMTYENYKACTGPKRLLVVPGAGHGMSYLVDREGYEKTVLQFFREFDTV